MASSSSAGAPSGESSLGDVSAMLQGLLSAATALPSQAWQQVTPASAALESMARDALGKLSDLASESITTLSGTRVMQNSQDHMEWVLFSRSPLRLPVPVELDYLTMVGGVQLATTAMDKVSAYGFPGILRSHPVTICLMGANVVAFLYPGGLLHREVCLSPYCVLEKGQWIRLFLPSIVHKDLPHLLGNLSGALSSGMDQESSSGSVVFALELLGLTALTHGLYVLWAWQGHALAGGRDSYYSGPVGLSGVLLALEVVLGERQLGTRTVSVLGLHLNLPSNYKWALQLALTHLFRTDSSWAGHLCGVAAGLTCVYLLDPVLSLLKVRPSPRWDPAGGGGAGRQPRFYGAGTTGGRVVITESRRRRAAWWRSWSLSLGSQVGLFLIATGVAYVSNRARSTGQGTKTRYWHL